MPVIQSFQNFPPSPHEQTAEFSVSIGGNINVAGENASGATFRVKIGGSLNVSGELVFEIPPPYTDEIEENAFAVQIYTARLLDETNAEILISDAVRDAPKSEFGENISITVGKKDLALVSIEKLYTFQIGTWSTLAAALAREQPAWETVCADVRLRSRSFSIGRAGRIPGDSLSFEIADGAKSKLNSYPQRNYVLYNSLLTDVNIESSDKIPTSDGDFIRTTANAFPNLTFYKILNFVKERCGFAGVETNIPNFSIVRADFSFNQSYARSLAGVCGMYEPIYSIVDNALRVQTKFARLPEDFEPRALTIDDYSQLDLQIPASTHVDGAELDCRSSDQISYHEQRFETFDFDNGRFGQSGYTEVFVTEEWYDYFDVDGENLGSEKVGEKRETYLDGVQTGETEMTKTLDSQGFVTRQINKTKSRIPLPENDFEPSLELISEDEYLPTYKIDPRRPRQKTMTSAVTNRRAIVVTDEENTYFGEPFEQEYLEAHKSGNLTEAMTYSPGLLLSKTIIETFKESNGQTTTTRETINHLRGASTDPDSEVLPGSPSLRGNGAKSKNSVLWADGVSTNARTGGEIIKISGGELSQKFLKALAKIILERRRGGFQEGSLQIPGYHKSMRKGVFFTVFDRNGNPLGRFVCESVRSVFANLGQAPRAGRQGQTVMTTVQISAV